MTGRGTGPEHGGTGDHLGGAAAPPDAGMPRLTPADDAFHPTNGHPWWTETLWFAFMIPERRTLGYVYPIFRPAHSTQFGGVLVFDDTAELPWELPFFHYDWHERIPAGLDLRDARLPGGMRWRVLEPNRVLEVGYDHPDLTLDLRYEAAMPALVTRGTPPFAHGHIDQLCHVTGTMVLRGESMHVDCLAMRDRSWGPRRDGRQRKVAYAYAAPSDRHAFLAVSVQTGETDRITTGFLMRDGTWSRLRDGERRVERDEQGRPTAVRIDGRDELGRGFGARGEVTARQIFTAYPSMLCWDSLVRWDVDGEPGWGEDQDVWKTDEWSRYRRDQGKTR